MIKPECNRNYSFWGYTEMQYLGLGFNLIETKFFVFQLRYGGYVLVEKDQWYAEDFQKGLTS